MDLILHSHIFHISYSLTPSLFDFYGREIKAMLTPSLFDFYGREIKAMLISARNLRYTFLTSLLLLKRKMARTFMWLYVKGPDTSTTRIDASTAIFRK